ncbi:MAG: hypothetical protein KOO69_03640 [Victivallales bacterium]|nr:hypothetical protein [Victivallales bacterium]
MKMLKDWKLPPLAVFGFLLPNIIGFLVFVLFPVMLSFMMSFTNWTLKSAVKLEFVGLRNFTDLLGMQALGNGNSLLYAAYVGSVALLLAGMVLFLWSYLKDWKGIRFSGSLLAGIGIMTILTAFQQAASHGFIIVGILAVFFGLVTTFKEGNEWTFGKGIIPSILMLAGVLGLFLLNDAMWQTYEPRDARFWKFLYNTFYMMLGIPIAMAGSLALAILLNEKLPVNSRRSGFNAAAVCIICGLVCMWITWSIGFPNTGLLVGVLWLIAALGLAFNVVSFRTIYYLPTFTAGVAIMVLWKALYNPETGPINIGLAWMTGIPISELPKWLSSYVWAKPALIFMGTWIAIGGTNMLLYLEPVPFLRKA